MQGINAWLQSKKDFEQGKALYLRYGTNTFFKNLLEQGPTPFNIKKLGAELKELAPASPAIIPPAPESKEPDAAPVSPIEEQAPEHNSKDFYKYLQLKEVLKTRYKQLERNMFELDASNRENMTYLIALQIVKLTEQIRDIWRLIDYYDQHGKLPSEDEPIPEKEYTPLERIQLLMQSTSKAKARLKSGTCRNLEATKQLIEENTKKITELRRKAKNE